MHLRQVRERERRENRERGAKIQSSKCFGREKREKLFPANCVCVQIEGGRKAGGLLIARTGAVFECQRKSDWGEEEEEEEVEDVTFGSARLLRTYVCGANTHTHIVHGVCVWAAHIVLPLQAC